MPGRSLLRRIYEILPSFPPFILEALYVTVVWLRRHESATAAFVLKILPTEREV